MAKAKRAYCMAQGDASVHVSVWILFQISAPFWAVKALCSYSLKIFHSFHRIFEQMHETLNVDKK